MGFYAWPGWAQPATRREGTPVPLSSAPISRHLLVALLVLGACQETTAPDTPEPILVTISVGMDGTCAVDASGVTYCTNPIATLDSNTCNATSCPPGLHRILGLPAMREVLLAEHPFGDAYCGLAQSNEVYCWGTFLIDYDGGGLIGPAPARLPGAPTATALTLGPGHACLVSADGDGVYCVGDYEAGKRGQGPAVPPASWDLIPNLVPNSATFTNLAAGWYHSCGLTDDGVISCWGRPQTLGNPAAALITDQAICDGDLECVVSPVPVQSVYRYSALGASAHRSCGVRTITGIVDCWGQDTLGNDSVPTAVPLSAAAIGVAVSLELVCAWTVDGAGYCWGSNEFGLLGVGPGVDFSATPMRVQSPVPFVSMDISESHACGLDPEGALWCWGDSWSAGLTGSATIFTPRRVTIHPSGSAPSGASSTLPSGIQLMRR